MRSPRLRNATGGWEMGAPIAVAVIAVAILTAGFALYEAARPGAALARLCDQGACYNVARETLATGEERLQSLYGLHIAMNVKVQDLALGAALIAMSVGILLALAAGRAGLPESAVRSLRIAATAAVTFFVYYFLLTKAIDILTGLFLGLSSRSLKLYWYDLCVAGFLVLTAIVIARTMRERARWARDWGDKPADTSPRLILPCAYETLAMAFGLVMTAFALLVEGSKYFLGAGPIFSPIDVPSYPIVLVLLVAIPFTLWMSPQLRTSLAIVMDVVDHFFVPAREPRISEQRRERLERTVGRLMEGCDRANLLIVAHSQGSVVALDALRAGAMARQYEGRIGELRLLTLGSPIHHIYEHYFSHLYPPVSREALKLDSVANVAWINVYRADDYVGQAIRGVTDALPDNLYLPTLGEHDRYWEADVLDHLEAQRPGFLPA
jgi:hypothetical protein